MRPAGTIVVLIFMLAVVYGSSKYIPRKNKAEFLEWQDREYSKSRDIEELKDLYEEPDLNYMPLVEKRGENDQGPGGFNKRDSHQSRDTDFDNNFGAEKSMEFRDQKKRRFFRN